MINFLLNLKLRVKLLLAFGSILVLSVLLVLIFFRSLSELNLFQTASEKIDAVNLGVLEMDASIQNFIYEGYKKEDFQQAKQSPVLQIYNDNLKQVREELVFLRKAKIPASDSLANPVFSALDKIQNHVVFLTENLKVRGFKDFGLEGELRQAIHQVENSSFRYDKADMLMLRRHEKDFFLRKDLKYKNEFNKKIESFTELINSTRGAGREEILVSLENYQRLFNKVVEIETEIGLREDEGIKGDLNRDLKVLRRSIENMRSAIKESSLHFRQTTTITLITLFAVQIGLALLMAIFYADLITRAVKELAFAMQDLANGAFPKKLIIKSEEEIGATKKAFNQLLDRLKAATEFAATMGDGNLKAQYDNRFKQDILARSMMKMQAQLQRAQEKQAMVNWANQGLAQLNDILKNENATVTVLGDQIISHLVQYLKANQGALYLLRSSSGEGFLERIATYAYGKKKFMDQRVELGQGLVGQCALEKETIILTDVPKAYVKITSGLGEATPQFVIIAPMMAHGQLTGVLELASFQKMEEQEVQFLEKISENIGALFFNKTVNEETSRLLEEAREKAAQLLAQEEEIRQNAEERQAVQEQMDRQQKRLTQELNVLRARMKQHGLEVEEMSY